MLGQSIDEKLLAKRLIINSLKIEETLVNVLKSEVKILNRKSNVDIEYSELKNINNTIKHIVYVVTILDDRIEKALNILNTTTEKNTNIR